MTRLLSQRDRDILRRLVPEIEDLEGQGLELVYMNVLPPVANHHSRDSSDFERRIRGLPDDDIRYLGDLVLQGEESTGCLGQEFAEAFFAVVGERISGELEDRLREAYESGEGCPAG